MRVSLVLFACLCVPSLMAQKPSVWELPNFSDRVDVRVANRSEHAVNALAVLNVADVRKIAPQFPGTFAIATELKAPVSFLQLQADDLDGDGRTDEVAIEVSLAPHEEKTVSIYYSTTLHDTIPAAKRVHASHRYGYNQATVAFESELIGYRTYGGFFFDVQAHAAGHTGLFNSALGYSRTSAPPADGEDIIHLGDTLGLGGLFLRADGSTYRPPLNTPDYTHRKPKPGEPIYRVVATGPLRAIVEAQLPHWNLGKDDVALRALYEIREGEESVRCRWWLKPLRLSHTYEVGAGVRGLPSPQVLEDSRLIVSSGVQDAKVGSLSLGISFREVDAKPAGVLQTPDGSNHIALFTNKLDASHSASGQYAFAAAWSGSGWRDPITHMRDVLKQEAIAPEITVLDHTVNPEPRTLEGEPK